MKTHTERFDEAFKILLVVVTISLSSYIAFCEDITEPKFFSYSLVPLVGTIVLWAYATLRGEEIEYNLKIMAWYLLMFAYIIVLTKLTFGLFLLPPLVTSMINLASLAVTFPILRYLKNTITKHYVFTVIMLLIISLSLFVLDVLYSFGFMASLF